MRWWKCRPQQLINPAQLHRLIHNLVTAENPAALHHLLVSHPELQQPDLDAFLTERLQEDWQKDDLPRVVEWVVGRAFLEHYRTHGLEAVLADCPPLPLAQSSPFGQLLQLSYERADLPRRAELARRTLGDVRRGSEPEMWAEFHRELADCLAQSEGADRAEHIEEALSSFQAALEIWGHPPYAGSELWAQTVHSRAATFRRRAKGNRADNLKEAIEFYQEALTVRTKAIYPLEWASTQHGLGTAWLEMPADDKGVHVLEAMEHYENALTIRTRGDWPALWAETTRDLATAYLEKPGPERGQNVEQAIRLCQEVLEVFRPDQHLLDWGRSQVNLGSAYILRLRGDRTENLNQAIECYNRALKLFSPQTYPADWARTQTDLAVAYWHYPAGQRADNLAKAAKHYQAALDVFTSISYPIECASIQTGLGNLYCQPDMAGDRAENLERAIQLYETALQVRTETDDPAGWATLQNNLGNAYADRIKGNRVENQEKAIACYERALRVRTREFTPDRWAETMNNLGAIYSERLADSPVKNQAQAIIYLRQALEIHTPDSFPNDARRAARNLAYILFAQQQWAEAAKAYRQAILAGQVLFEAAYTEAGRRVEATETSRLYGDAAYCAWQLESPTLALEQLEQGKTRLLAEALALAGRDVAGLPQAEQQRLKQAREQVRSYQNELQIPGPMTGQRPSEAIRTDLAAAYANLRQIIQEIRTLKPLFMPEGLTFERIVTLVEPGSALIAPLITSQGSLVFIIRPNNTEPEVLSLPQFKAADLTAMTQSYLRTYLNRHRDKLDPAWLETIEATGQAIWQHVIGPITARLERDITHLLLLPQGGLQLFPLHAAQSPDGTYFGDRYVVQYAPSAYALAEANDRAKESARQKKSLFAVVNPTQDLPFAPVEGESLETLFAINQEILYESAATKETVCAGLGRHTYVHFGCHGIYNWHNPLNSALFLANERRLTLDEIMSIDLSPVRLVTLSACETGLTEVTQAPDEYIGLPAGFLQGGAPAVISTLWTVSDLSTALLMERFYRYHLKGLSLPVALRQAQRWLRNKLSPKQVAIYQKKAVPHLEKTITTLKQQANEAFEQGDAFLSIRLSQKRQKLEASLAQIRQQLDEIQNNDDHDPPFAHPYYWAAFTITGQ